MFTDTSQTIYNVNIRSACVNHPYNTIDSQATELNYNNGNILKTKRENNLTESLSSVWDEDILRART